MKSPVSFSFKSFLLSAALSLGVSAVVAGAWGVGLLASPAALFMFDDPATPSVPPQAWVVLLLVAAAGLGGGLAAERMGARRALLVLACALAVLCAASLLVSRFLHLDIVFAPMMFAALGSLLTAQARRLWKIDSLLTENVERLAVRRSALEGRGADGRLVSGLKLLNTVLPLEEAVIFRLDEWGAPVQAARLRAQAKAGARDDGGSNSAWREGVRTCERVMRSRELEVKAEGTDEGGGASTVAVPLCHDGQAVGALLLRLRGRFDEEDRPLLENVSAQFARNLQRDDARALDVPRPRQTFFSSRAARQRLEAFGVVSGLLTEQGFAGLVLSEGSDAHAVAYLDGTLAFVNPAMRRSARLGTAEWRKLDLFSLLERFRTGVFDEPQIAVRRVLQTGQAYERELTFIDRDETLLLRIALVTSAAADEREGEGAGTPLPLCLAVTVRDVTRMKELDKLKSDMLSLMSHELRTPVTSINGFAELLMADDKMPEDAREFLAIIHTESQRVARMLSTFLSVAKLEQKDRQEVFIAPVTLDDVVRETITNYQPVAKRKRIRLVERDGQRLPPVAADRGLITQAVANLVDNAIKYSPERTSVTLSTALEADAVRLTVEDRGYGIPPEDQDKVWEKFYRVARDGRVKEEESTGLGLSFVRQVVEQHGGQVFLESEPGLGSRVGFTLPRL
ncbi:MAG TPA: GAF domain-containing sensor histidine kinase [Pyrinomonadaceae bacterium]|nr:GAF domain-containing sensor histidine kinase [Pyrinomonadaceae bacterium]